MDPLVKKQIKRFTKNRRGLYSFWIVTLLFVLSLGSEWICNNKPLILRFEGSLYFPMFSFYPAQQFGQEVTVTPDYKALRKSERYQQGAGNFMLLPPIPYSPNESVTNLPSEPPSRPTTQNLLGTDDRGRDLLTRLIYGFRNSMVFALVSWIIIVLLAYFFGAIQGYSGGRVDLYGQRLTEIWNALPVLYVIIFLISIVPSSLILLILIWVTFSWTGLASYIRAEVLRIRKLDFILASKALGVGTPRVLIRHILPNTLTPIITFSPFIISASVGALAALDYLGLGLPAPTSSWGELLRQGKENLNSWWLVVFPFTCLFTTLLLLNFVGEALRSAFDTREH